jgi:L-ascorbate metabolism protein UlaG (beta-lactamase superfamily)
MAAGVGSIVIDPGVYSDSSDALATATAVLLTHSHHDHLDKKALLLALAQNPEMQVWADSTSHGDLMKAGANLTQLNLATPGLTVRVGDFNALFGGGKHAKVLHLIPVGVNVTYLIEADNVTVYHPGDSFDLPAKTPDVLLAPVSGPWLKLAEVADFVTTIRAKKVIPMHDHLNSDAGNALYDDRLSRLVEAYGGKYYRIPKRETWELT